MHLARASTRAWTGITKWLMHLVEGFWAGPGGLGVGLIASLKRVDVGVGFY